jgi:hypothetical protein
MQRILLCLLFLGFFCVSAQETATQAKMTISATAATFQGHSYMVVIPEKDLEWHQAKAACEALGGHLATITSKEEQAFITKLADGRYLFLGATDEKVEGTYVWVTGEPFTFTDWMEGQPNNYGDAENWLATYDGGQWVDVANEGSAFWMPTGYICEWEGVKEKK